MASQSPAVLGIDFGTTNTVVALADAEGQARLVRFHLPLGASAAAFRSVLSFQEGEAGRGLAVEAGPWAVEAFLDDPQETRLIQSFKSFAASHAFAGTSIWGKRFQYPDLMWRFLHRMLARAEGGLDVSGARAVAGRPVVFAGAEPDEALAMSRYGEAYARLGVADLAYAYEPVAAALFFARRLQGAATVLVADFGGGTSDFSLMRFRREGGVVRAEPLSRSGVGVAGDAFDYRIIDHLVSPRLGKGGEYGSGGKTLPVPARYYSAFARWSQLALMKGSRELREIREIARTAMDREAMQRFIALIEGDHGWRLYQAVSAAKERLSSHEVATFRLQAGELEIEAEIARADFETWIARELAAIEAAVDDALAKAGLKAGDVDKVFLTGGSSFVPAVREIFLRRFGKEAIETGGEFESIATGLALIAAAPDREAWVQSSSPV